MQREVPTPCLRGRMPDEHVTRRPEQLIADSPRGRSNSDGSPPRCHPPARTRCRRTPPPGSTTLDAVEVSISRRLATVEGVHIDDETAALPAPKLGPLEAVGIPPTPAPLRDGRGGGRAAAPAPRQLPERRRLGIDDLCTWFARRFCGSQPVSVAASSPSAARIRPTTAARSGWNRSRVGWPSSNAGCMTSATARPSKACTRTWKVNATTCSQPGRRRDIALRCRSCRTAGHAFTSRPRRDQSGAAGARSCGACVVGGASTCVPSPPDERPAPEGGSDAMSCRVATNPAPTTAKATMNRAAPNDPRHRRDGRKIGRFDLELRHLTTGASDRQPRPADTAVDEGGAGRTSLVCGRSARYDTTS